MIEGFKFELKSYCSGCGEFSEEVKTIKLANKNNTFFQTSITCTHSATCERIKNHIEKRIEAR